MPQRSSKPASHPASRFRQLIADNFHLALLGLLVAIVAAGGGVFRMEAAPLIYIRPAAILIITAALVKSARWDFAGLKYPLLILLIFAAIMAAQLIPLPPSLWLALPGHALYAEAAAAAGLAQPWRPLTLIPGQTISSLLTLLPPLAVLILMAAIPRPKWVITLYLALALCAASAILGIAQIMDGPESALYFFDRSDTGLPIGLLANRNHQAVLLACALPMLAIGCFISNSYGLRHGIRIALASALAMILLPIILLTQSRAGLVISALFVLALVAFAVASQFRLYRRGTRPPLSAVAGIALPVIVLVGAAFLARATGFERIENSVGRLNDEQRWSALPVEIPMIRDFFPFGSGFGTFAEVFRQYEPDAALHSNFFNHAHNELVEMLITGGLPAALIMAAFIVWLGLSFVRTLQRGFAKDALLSLAGFIVILMLLGASLVDYPLRTPLMATLFSLACAWMTKNETAGAKNEAADRLHFDHRPSSISG